MKENDHDKIIRLEQGQRGICDEIKEIKENHLFHLSEDVKNLRNDITELKLKIARWSGGVAVLIILAQIILRFIK
jgi:hypothetical protein